MLDFKNRYSIIACVNNKGVIGKEGQLLYNIKADMENFRSLTVGNVVIMGRKTFESFPNGKPLADRVNIIVTHQKEYSIDNEWDNVYIVHSLKEVDDLCEAYFSDRKLFIIGGGHIYNIAYELGIVDEAIITLVNDDAEGDAYLPKFSGDDKYRVLFKTNSLRDHPQDLYYKYIVYKKIN